MQTASSAKQAHFLSVLGKYVNQGCLSRFDYFNSLVSSSFPFHKNASQIIESYRSSRYSSANPEQYFEIPAYAGNNPAVISIINYLHSNLKNDLFAAILHGSIATGEEIPYSDFDALVIIKDSVFEDPSRLAKVAIHLSKCYSIMISFDPLQHHGWFVMTESDLLNFPYDYFPTEIFSFCKSLTGPVNIPVVCGISRPDVSFIRLVNSLEKQLHAGYSPANKYVAKSILSEFMLLPTLFIQKKTGKGIWKKFSFEKARSFFTNDEWKVMDEISEIRIEWENPVSVSENKIPYIVTPSVKKKQKSASGLLSSKLEISFKSGLSERMLAFIKTMKIKSDEN